MDTIVTIMQVLLTVAFTGAGVGKLTQPYVKLSRRMAWVNDFSPQQIRLIGALELCGAIGMMVPILLTSLPMLAVLGAVGLALIMAGAMATHLRRSEYSAIVMNLILLGLALFVIYGRWVGFAA